MKRSAFGLALILASAPASAQQLEVASGDWSNVPLMAQRHNVNMGEDLLDQMHDIAARGTCSLRGFSQRRIDLNIPFMVQFTETGGIGRVVVRDMGCRELEALVANVVLRMGEQGEFRANGQNQTRWYRSELSFVSM